MCTLFGTVEVGEQDEEGVGRREKYTSRQLESASEQFATRLGH